VNSRVGTTFGKYNITRPIGKGGMGEVYEAYDTDKGRTVALKILAEEFSHDPDSRTRFLRECHAAAILQEPHVIPIHDYGDIDGNLFIDMRLVRGQTLHELLAKGPLAPSRAVAIITQVAAALDAAHAEGLIHRDVKPQNIIVNSADFAYLVDFGIAEAKGETRLTRAGTLIGTYRYMAPERFSDEAATLAVDVYSLACVLYESLTGDAPFTSNSLENLLTAHIHSPPPRPSAANPRVPAAFDAVIARGMAKDPDDRYGTAGGLGRAAQRALQSSGPNLGNTATVASPGGPSLGTSPPFTGPIASPYPDPTAPPYGDPTASPYSAPTAPYVAPTAPPYLVPTAYAGPTAPYSGPTAAPPPGYSPAAPSVAAHDRDSGDRRRGWVLTTVIAVAAVLILAGIGVIIGQLTHRNSGPAAGPPASTESRSAESATPTTTIGQTSSGQATPSSSAAAAPVGRPPPLVTGPDQSSLHQSCDQGFALPTATGFATHAGRGTPETSCYFANSVLNSYWAAYGNASPLPRAVSAPGAVDCTTVPGARCNGANFLMECQQFSGDGFITCTGGNNARVYLW
jgi:serine/threonine protein kinase